MQIGNSTFKIILMLSESGLMLGLFSENLHTAIWHENIANIWIHMPLLLYSSFICQSMQLK